MKISRICWISGYKEWNYLSIRKEMLRVRIKSENIDRCVDEKRIHELEYIISI